MGVTVTFTSGGDGCSPEPVTRTPQSRGQRRRQCQFRARTTARLRCPRRPGSLPHGWTGRATAMSREWLDVPFSEKDQAKALGARWDPAAKRWYAPRSGMAKLAPWAALPDLPALLPGEDRSFGPGLFVDLVPSSCWFTNARSCIAERDWERVRRLVVGRAGRRCEVAECGRTEDRAQGVWLEAHLSGGSTSRPPRCRSCRRLVCLLHLVPHDDSPYGLAGIRGVDRGGLRAPAHRDRHDGGRGRKAR